MSRHFFTPNAPFIAFRTTVQAQRTARALLALDTGASFCQISNRIAASIGLDMTSSIREIEIVTGSGVVQAPVLYLPSLFSSVFLLIKLFFLKEKFGCGTWQGGKPNRGGSS